MDLDFGTQLKIKFAVGWIVFAILAFIAAVKSGYSWHVNNTRTDSSADLSMSVKGMLTDVEELYDNISSELTMNVTFIQDTDYHLSSEAAGMIWDIIYSRGYTSCRVFDYCAGEDNGGAIHMVFDDKQYMCIYYEPGNSEPLILYDCVLTQQLIDNWEYN